MVISRKLVFWEKCHVSIMTTALPLAQFSMGRGRGGGNFGNILVQGAEKFLVCLVYTIKTMSESVLWACFPTSGILINQLFSKYENIRKCSITKTTTFFFSIKSPIRWVLEVPLKTYSEPRILEDLQVSYHPLFHHEGQNNAAALEMRPSKRKRLFLQLMCSSV